MTTANEITDIMRELGDEEQRRILCRFFKTAPGQYGHGDRFFGIRVPQTRAIVKETGGDVDDTEIVKLLYSPWHEARLAGFLLLVEKMKRARKDAAARKAVVGIYLEHARQANNWDLVDLSAPYILGSWVLGCSDRSILDVLAGSDNLWEQRIAIVSTLTLIRNGIFDDTLRISLKLLSHPHDLIHKAVGWMLREAGKRDADVLRRFLDLHQAEMARTTLRYAIEKFSPEERAEWLRR